MRKVNWMKIALCMLLLLQLVTGKCNKCDKNDTNCIVRCTCSSKSQDLEVTEVQSTIFVDATRIEITNCRNVIMYPNLFRKSYSLTSLIWLEIENLHIDAALSLPEFIQEVELVNIGYLDHFPVPGPSSALFHSIAKLKRFNMVNVTVSAPAAGPFSSFLDLPISEVHFNAVKFNGTIPKGALEFNSTELMNFKAVHCHFSTLNESSFQVNAQESVIISKCEFDTVEGMGFKASGKSVALDENTFQNLSGQHALALNSIEYLSISNNKFKNLGGQSTLALEAADGATVTIQDNQLPCGCYAKNAVISLAMKDNDTSCVNEKSLVCALMEKQECIHSNGKKERIPIFNSTIITCPLNKVSALMNHSMIQLLMILAGFMIYLIL